MAIDARTRQILWGKAGATCSFPGCRRQLVKDASLDDREVLAGEIAHIVAQRQGGPRRDNEVPGGIIDGYCNLILLCNEHHELVDHQQNTYPVDRLLQFKTDHEEWVRSRLSKDQEFDGLSRSVNRVTETVFSTLLPISSYPIMYTLWIARPLKTRFDQRSYGLKTNEYSSLSSFEAADCTHSTT